MLTKFKTYFSFMLAFFLLWKVVNYIGQEEVLNNIKRFTIGELLILGFILFISYLISGLQFKLAIFELFRVKISNNDVFIIPITQNLWGYIIPFQGSFVYCSLILKGKYKINFSQVLLIYMVITLLSLIVGAIFGLFYSTYTGSYKLLPVYLVLALLPLWLYVCKYFFQKSSFQTTIGIKFFTFLNTVLKSLMDTVKNVQLVLKLIALDIFYVIVYALWSFYISEVLNLGISYPIHVVLAFFMKLSLIVKFTPGNIGITQFFSGGVFKLYGYPLEYGLLISTMQLVLLIIFSFPIATVFSISQWKYLSFGFGKNER